MAKRAKQKGKTRGRYGDPDPRQIEGKDPDPHQICWIRIRIYLQLTSKNVWNMRLFEHFFKVLSLYLETGIRIRIKEKSRIRIRIRIKVTSSIRISIKVTSRIRIRNIEVWTTLR